MKKEGKIEETYRNPFSKKRTCIPQEKVEVPSIAEEKRPKPVLGLRCWTQGEKGAIRR